jgi:hypothetical protein
MRGGEEDGAGKRGIDHRWKGCAAEMAATFFFQTLLLIPTVFGEFFLGLFPSP